jgi:hypothetical protein
VLILSIDGLHEADLTDPATKFYMPNIAAFEQSAIHYANAKTVAPSDSVPTSLSYFTGAGPKTTGVYYEDTYNRALYAPGATLASPPGTLVSWRESLDKNSNVLNGGGNADASSLDPTLLPQVQIGASLQPVYPHDYLKVNTIFEVAHQAGLRTAYIEKHPAYEMLNGPSGQGLSDFYAPESNAKVKLVNGVLTDSSKGTRITKDLGLSQAYDDHRLFGLFNQIQGLDSRGDTVASTPAIYGMNFIAVNTAQKDTSGNGGITLDPSGNEIVSSGLASALSHVDSSFGQIISSLKLTQQYNKTLVILTAHGGNSPRIGSAVNEPTEYITGSLNTAGIFIKQITQDDSALIWLADQSQRDSAADVIADLDPAHIDSVLTGAALLAAGFGDPTTDERAPDLVVKFKPGVLVGTGKRAEHGGFSEDDTHVPLLIGSDGLADYLKGTSMDDSVSQTQIAVTTLDALGLDPSQLQGAAIEGTTALPIPVPEPTSIILCAAGGLLTSNSRRRR